MVLAGWSRTHRLFEEDGFWSCPPKFWFCDDIWLSYFADSLGWTLRRSGASVSMDNDGLDQYHQLSRTKTQMLRHFVSLGWNVSSDATFKATRAEDLSHADEPT